MRKMRGDLSWLARTRVEEKRELNSLTIADNVGPV